MNTITEIESSPLNAATWRGRRSRPSHFGAIPILAFAIMYIGGPRPAPSQADAGKKGDVEAGRTLYGSLRCNTCHEVEARGIHVPPTLAYAGSKFKPEWIRAYLARPSRRRWAKFGKRPILRMPDFMFTPRELRDITAFLMSCQDDARFPPLPPQPEKRRAKLVAAGERLFGEYACNGCHTVGGKGGKMGPDLTAVGSRLRREYLAVFLKNPQDLIPESPMQNFDLWDDEMKQLVAYLASLQE